MQMGAVRYVLFIFLCIMVAGCGTKPDPFVGSWVNGENPSDTIYISRTKGIYLIKQGGTTYQAQKADYGDDLTTEDIYDPGPVGFSYDAKSGLLSAGIQDHVFVYKRDEN